MNQQEKQALLAEHLPFWEHLSAEQQERLTIGTKHKVYPAGSNVHGRMGECTGILVVLSGELRSYILSEDGREITLYRLHPGSLCILSASCVLETITFDVSIDAMEDTGLLLIQADVFNRLASENVYMDRDVYKEAVARFSDVMWTMQQILFMKLDRRLAIYLDEEIRRSGTRTLHTTHEQIAKNIGSAREAVTRMLKYFAAEGYVTLGRGTVTVENPDAVSELAALSDDSGFCKI